MPKPTDAPGEAPHVLREIIPIERSFASGGASIDETAALWFEWQDEAAGVPDWAAFIPFKHPQILADVTLCKQMEGRYHCILVGESARSWLPTHLQGQTVDEAMPAGNAGDVIMRFDRALADGLPNYAEKTMAWSPGRDFVKYRVLYLPFRCAKDGCPRVLSVLDFETEID